jgi:hypothetical protein
MKAYLAAGLIIASVTWHARAAPPAGAAGWMLAYEDKTTNQLMWDQRTRSLIHSRVPRRLAEHLLAALGGPPEPVYIKDRRYVTMAACRPHSCDEKGFFWIDTRTGVGLGAYAVDGEVSLGSNGLRHQDIPAEARRALIQWFRDQGMEVNSIRFAGRGGGATMLDVAAYQPPPRFRPPLAGPAFDCARASGPVETAICADEELSALDLALSDTYQQVWKGSATSHARAQLQRLQLDWLKARGQDCAGDALNACLKREYRAQQDRIRHWLPTN